MASAIPCLFFCMLLLPHLGSSDLIAGSRGTRRLLLRLADRSRAPPSTATCSTPSGPSSSNNKLSLVHRLSPCSPLSGARSQEQSSTDVLHRDGLRLRSLYEAHSNMAPAASASPATEVTIPTTGSPIKAFPGTLDYTVVVGYGTPAQQFAVAFDTAFSVSLLRCKPCTSGGKPCGTAFDPRLSSSFAAVPCGLPDCPGTCSGTRCPFVLQNSATSLANGTFAKDTLTLSLSLAMDTFVFGCMEEVDADLFYGAAGVIDLSRNKNSVASRIPPSPGNDATVAFSYCLPSSTTSHGFLTIGSARPEYPGRGVKYVPLVNNPAFQSLYFVELIGISVGGTDVPIPPAASTANFTLMDVATSFTYLAPPAYTAVRSKFRKEMARYPVAPPFNELETCYNFTGQKFIEMPVIALKFGNGVSLELLDIKQAMYFPDPSNIFSVGCLAFAPSTDKKFPITVIGNLVQRSMEVAYDVRGGKVGLVPGSC